MELKKKILVSILTFIVIPYIVGLTFNFTYDIIKNHSYGSKSGLSIEFNLNIKFK